VQEEEIEIMWTNKMVPRGMEKGNDYERHEKPKEKEKQESWGVQLQEFEQLMKLAKKLKGQAL